MVKKVLIFLLFCSIADANNVYETNCVKCHKKLPVGIDKFFYRYVLKYSGKRNVKAAMINYLKIPTKQHTIMPDAFIERFGIKEPTTLNNTELEEAVDIYWDKYKIFQKLK